MLWWVVRLALLRFQWPSTLGVYGNKLPVQVWQAAKPRVCLLTPLPPLIWYFLFSIWAVDGKKMLYKLRGVWTSSRHHSGSLLLSSHLSLGPIAPWRVRLAQRTAPRLPGPMNCCSCRKQAAGDHFHQLSQETEEGGASGWLLVWCGLGAGLTLQIAGV